MSSFSGSEFFSFKDGPNAANSVTIVQTGGDNALCPGVYPPPKLPAGGCAAIHPGERGPCSPGGTNFPVTNEKLCKQAHCCWHVDGKAGSGNPLANPIQKCFCMD